MSVSPFRGLCTAITFDHWWQCDLAIGATTVPDSGGAGVLWPMSVINTAGTASSVTTTSPGIASNDAGTAVNWGASRACQDGNLYATQSTNFSLAIAFELTGNITSTQAIFTLYGSLFVQMLSGNTLQVYAAAVGQISQSVALSLNTPHLLVVTNTAGVWTVTIDGVAQAVTPQTATAPTGSCLLACNYAGGYNDFFSGVTGDVLYRLTPLAAAQTAALWREFSAGQLTSGTVQFTAATAFGTTSTAFLDENINTGMNEAASSSVNYVGLVLAAPAAVSKIGIASRQGNPGTESLVHWGQNLICASANPNPSGPVTVVGNVQNVRLEGEVNYFEVSGAPASAYWGVQVPTTGYRYLNIFDVYGEPTSGVPSKPCAPTASPPGGAYPGSASITLSSLTTSAEIWYTTDGSTPSVNGATSQMYAAPFLVSSAVTLMAVAYDPNAGTYSVVSKYVFACGQKGLTLSANMTPLDNLGLSVEARAGCIVWDAKTQLFWRYGMFMRVVNSGLYPAYMPCIKAYSSPDLVNWTNQGTALSAPPANTLPIGTGGPNVQMQRSHVHFNPATGQYVMWVNGESAASTAPTDMYGMIVAVSVSPQGPFSVVSKNNIGYGFHDHSVFVDQGNSAYLIARAEDVRGLGDTSGTYNGAIIATLDPTHTSIVSAVVLTQFAGSFASPDAIGMFRRGATYFLYSGAGNFYNASLTFEQQFLWSSSPTSSAWNIPTGTTTQVGALAYTADPVTEASPYVNNSQWSDVFVVSGWQDADGNPALAVACDHWAQGTTYWAGSPYTGISQSGLGIVPVTFSSATQMSVPRFGVDLAATAWQLSDYFVPAAQPLPSVQRATALAGGGTAATRGALTLAGGGTAGG